MHVTVVTKVALALAAALTAPLCAAQIDKPCLQGESWSFENDYLGRGKVGTDRWYTTGLHAAWSFKRSCPSPTLDHLRAAGWKVLGQEPTVMATLGMNIYTPRDIEEPAPQLDDRPWGGFSFIGAGAFAYTGRVHELAEFRLGLLGAASGAGEAQRAFHRLIDDDRPAGWSNQLRPRLGGQLSYVRTQRFYDDDLPALLPKWAGVHVHTRASVGNVKTLAAAGVTLVAGERERIFGAPDEGDNVGVDFNNRYSTFKAPWLQPWTVYMQLQLSLVAYNALITGRTFTQRPQIELKRDVWMATLGLSYKVSGKTRLEYRIKWRSPEFESTAAAPDDRIQRYGEIRWVTDYDR